MLTQAVCPLYLCLPGGGVGQAHWETRVLKGPLEPEVRGIEQDLILYVGQLECANVPIEGWIIGPDAYHLLDIFLLYCVPPYPQWRRSAPWCDDLQWWYSHR